MGNISKDINSKFKNDKLKLKDAALKIGVSEQILAEYIKNQYQMNFTSFTNLLRVNEFKSLLEIPENKKYSLLGLAEEAGFNSKASFYRVFKRVEGMTPTQYLNSI